MNNLMQTKGDLMSRWLSASNRLSELARLADLWDLPGGFYLAYCRHPGDSFDVGMQVIRSTRVSRKLKTAATVATEMINSQADRGHSAAAEMILNREGVMR